MPTLAGPGGGAAFPLDGNLAGGIWFAFIGWVLGQAGRASYQELQVRQMLRGVQAQDGMATSLVWIPPDLTLQDAGDRYFMRYDHSSFPVDEYGRTIGLLTLRKVRRVPSDQWPASRVRDHMIPLGGQVVVPPDAPMDQVMAKLEDGGGGRDHHAIGSPPVAAPLANARRQSARQQIGPPEPGQAILKLTVSRITA